ncbi:MAG: class I SAM-dependent methyltransferase, partial [Candidatus Nanopelagicales bacterium]
MSDGTIYLAATPIGDPGDATPRLRDLLGRADVIAADFSLGMLEVGKARNPAIPFVAADALALPFADSSFDRVTISFGLRNVADRMVALEEFRRVIKPGGRLVICEFSHPTLAPFRRVYTEYLMAALPVLSNRVSSNPEAYRYLAESIRAWPVQQELAADIADAGWGAVQWLSLIHISQ